MQSFTYRFLEKLIKVAGIKNYYSMNVNEVMKVYDKKLSKLKADPPSKMFKHLDITVKMIGDFPCYTVTPENPTEKVVLFLHGGGYIMEIDHLHWNAVERIAREKKVTVVVPIYPLAPKYHYKDAFNMISEIYRDILKEHSPHHITIIGDSAGAQIALSFCQECILEGIAQPAKLILLSPPVDFKPDEVTMSRYQELDRIDPMISIGILSFVEKFWAAEITMDDYHISPIYGEFKGLPPMTVFIGTKEILYATIDKLKQKANQAGIECKIVIGEEMMHVWPYFLWSDESHTAFQSILDEI